MNDNIRELLERADRRYADFYLDDAISSYEEVVSAEPGNRYAVNRLARCFALQGHIKKLVKTCLNWHQYLSDNQHTELANAVAQAILDFDPGSVEGRICMLKQYSTTMSEEEYVGEIDKTVKYLVEVDQGEEAVKILNMAQETYPTNTEIAVKLADVLMSEGDINQAVRSYRNIISELESAGEGEKALDIYRRLELLTPDDNSPMLRLAEIYYGRGNYAEAAREYRNALRVDYNDPVALCGLGNSLMHLKDYNGAVLSFRKVVVIDPSHVEASEMLAQAYVKLGNIGDAIKLLLSTGANLSSCEDFEEAKRMYEAVLELYPNHSVAIRELSNAKDGIARKKAREEQILKMEMNRVKAQKAAKEARAAEEAKGETAAASTGKAGDSAGEGQLTRVIVGTAAPEGEIYNPVPFVIAKYPDMIPLMQQAITEAPSREVFGWQYLAVLDEKETSKLYDQSQSSSKKSERATRSTYNTASIEGGPIKSAFGDGESSFFGSGFSSSGAFSGSSSSSGGGLFGGNTMGIKSRFSSASSSTMLDDSGDDKKSESGGSGLSFLEKIQMQQKQKRRT
ncbi:MAG: tetratricopeptide repeat protein [bacterium]|nr:tetratricopeptide repeat protein [bacterium]